MAAQPKNLKKNIAGFYDGHGQFHPIRSGVSVRTGKDGKTTRAKARTSYDPEKAGDYDFPIERKERRERNRKTAEKTWEKQETARLERDVYGDADTVGKGKTLAQFVRAAGGLRITKNDAGELELLSSKESGKRGLVSKTGGKTLDYMFQAARESGYNVSDLYDLLDRLDDEISGGKATYATHGALDYRRNPTMKKSATKKVSIATKGKRAAAKKRTTAKKSARPRKNGLLDTFATAALGTSAAFNVYDRLNRATRTATPSATSGAGKTLRHNKARRRASAAQPSLQFHDKANDTAFMIHAEDLNKAKYANLKRDGRDGNDFYYRDSITGRRYFIRENPAKKTAAKATAKPKKNGLLSSVAGAVNRQRATNAFRRKLKAEAKLKRASAALKKRSAAVRKNPTVSKQRANCLKRYEEFQGRPSTKTIEILKPLAAPRDMWTLGTLLEIRLKGGEKLEFRRGLSGKNIDFLLCSDEANNQMWICGGAIATPDASIKDYFCVDVAEITNIIYLTEKRHLRDIRPQGYIHKLGEEGGKRPMLALDNKGFPIISGGDYYITELGIAD